MQASACIAGSALYVPSLLVPLFLAPFFSICTVSTLRRQIVLWTLAAYCPSCGHVYPRKHIVHTTSLLWRFSSLQARSKSVHVPCNRARSGNNPRKSPRPSISRPAPLPIYLFSPHPLPMSNRGSFAFPTYFFIFYLCSLGPIGLYHGFVITFCSPISYLYITLSSTGCCQGL